MDKPTILFIDNDKLIRKVTTQALGEKAYTILTAQSAEEGLQKLRTHDVHLIIIDQKIEDMTGLEFLKIAKQEKPDVITIMLTGHADIGTAIEAINEAGVYKFIIKPLNAFNLRITVFRAMETQRLLTEKKLLHKRIKANDDLIAALGKKYPEIQNLEVNIQ